VRSHSHMQNERSHHTAVNYAKEIREFLISNLLSGNAGTLDDDKLLVESGLIDSTGMLELVMFLERTYGIRVEPEELLPENLGSVKCLVEFLRKKGAKAVA